MRCWVLLIGSIHKHDRRCIWPEKKLKHRQWQQEHPWWTKCVPDASTLAFLQLFWYHIWHRCYYCFHIHHTWPNKLLSKKLMNLLFPLISCFAVKTVSLPRLVILLEFHCPRTDCWNRIHFSPQLQTQTITIDRHQPLLLFSSLWHLLDKSIKRRLQCVTSSFSKVCQIFN